MRTIILSCFLFLGLSGSLQLKAQTNPQPHFRNYSTEHGLPSPEVYTAFQDSKGYMWFGTDNGASRFDGYEFKNYGAKQGLSSNVVFDIFEDEEQNIWFGTMTGEAFVLDRDTIRPYKYNDLVLQYRQKFLAASLDHISSEGDFYFELRGVGILTIDAFGTECLHITDRASSNLIIDLEELPRVFHTPVGHGTITQNWDWGQFYMEKRIWRYEFVTQYGKFHLDLPAKYPTTYGRNFQAYRHSSGSLLIFGFRYLHCITKGKAIWSIRTDLHYNKLIEDQDGSIWICGNEGQGLRYFTSLQDLQEDKYQQFLTGLSISDIHPANDGGYWISSLEKGIFYCSNNKTKIYNKQSGLSEDLVRSIAFSDKENAVFIGCNNGDIFTLNLSQDQIESKISNPWNYHNFDLFYTEKNGNLWSNGAYWEHGKWNLVSYVHPVGEKEEFKTHKLDKVHLNSSNQIIGCNHIGFHSIDPDEKKVTYKSVHNGYRERTFALFSDHQDILWIGNSSGLHHFKDSIVQKVNELHPAFSTRVEDIDQYQNNKLVFGTKGWGVVIWDKKEDYIVLTEDQGLSSNMIEDVHIDEEGILWIGTLNGLNKVIFDENGAPIIRQFTVAHGLPSNEINKIKSHNGQVWLCTSGGLVKFQEAEAGSNSTAPIIQAIEVNGINQISGDLQRLAHQDNNLVFEFLTINYKQNGNIQYRFRLNEHDTWSYTHNRSVNYPALPPDQYRFEVQSKNEDGIWSNSTVQYFTIAPPWWATAWFITLASISFIASSFGMFQYRLQQLRKRSLVQQQISDLEKSALQAQMNPHFIFNCLNSIQNFILQHNSQKAVDFLSRFARLVRLHLNASIDGYITLQEEVTLLENYLILEQERFDHQFQFQLELDATIDMDQVQIPPLLLQPFVENAIIHGMTNTQDNGMIHIQFKQKEDLLQVNIIDNGNISFKDQAIRKSTPHKSVGISITQKRLAMLEPNLSNMIKINNIAAIDGKTIGTQVQVQIKCKILSQESQ